MKSVKSTKKLLFHGGSVGGHGSREGGGATGLNVFLFLAVGDFGAREVRPSWFYWFEWLRLINADNYWIKLNILNKIIIKVNKPAFKMIVRKWPFIATIVTKEKFITKWSDSLECAESSALSSSTVRTADVPTSTGCSWNLSEDVSRSWLGFSSDVLKSWILKIILFQRGSIWKWF